MTLSADTPSCGIALVPHEVPEIAAAVREAGAGVVHACEADALVYTEAGAAGELARVILPRHRWVALLTAGVDRWQQAGVIDDRRIWTCARGVYSAAVAEHAAAAILASSRRLFEASRQRTWNPLPGTRMSDTTVLIVGTGTIGRALAAILGTLRARVVGVNRSGDRPSGFAACYPVRELRVAVEQADVVVIAVPLTAQTRQLIDRSVFARMRPGAYLVNVARGEIVDTASLLEALSSGAIGGAVLDVTDPEPLPDGHRLWEFPQVVVTGHVANPNHGRPWDFHRAEIADHVGRNVRAFLERRPLDGLIEEADR